MNAVINGIRRLQNKTPETDFQRKDIPNSISALKAFLELQFPENFRHLKCSFSKPEINSFEVEGVKILVSPDIILSWEENGVKYLGGIKFHISKINKFTYQTSQLAAANLQLFLENMIAKEGEVVKPEYCLSIDIFGQRVCPAPENSKEARLIILEGCHELREIWNNVA